MPARPLIVDLLACFEAEPEIGEDRLSFQYVTERVGYRLSLSYRDLERRKPLAYKSAALQVRPEFSFSVTR